MKKERIIELKNEMKEIPVQTPEGMKSLFELCEGGVDKRVVYWNYVEKPLPLKERTIYNKSRVVNKIHDYGLIFKDGFEIRHVPVRYFKVYEAPINEVRERE